MINLEELQLCVQKIDILQYFQRITVTIIFYLSNDCLNATLVNKCLLKMGERMRENWNKYIKTKIKNTDEFLKLENLKRIFLSQRYITTFLRSLKIFENWTLWSLEKLLYAVEMKTITKNEQIITQGKDSNGFYIIFKGEVLITHKLKSKYKEKLDISNQLSLNSDLSKEKLSHDK